MVSKKILASMSLADLKRNREALDWIAPAPAPAQWLGIILHKRNKAAYDAEIKRRTEN